MTAPKTPPPPPAPRRDVLDARTQRKHEKARERQYRMEDRKKTVRHTGATLASAIGAALLLGWHPTMEELLAVPMLAWVIGVPLVFFGTAYVVHTFRHRGELHPILLPAPQPPPCTFFGPDFYVGVGWTEVGTQPGEWLMPGDEMLDPYVFITGTGAFQNTLIQGAPGTGKTAGSMKKFIAQAVRKYPKPPAIPRDADGRWLRIPTWDSPEADRRWRYLTVLRPRYERIPVARLRRWLIARAEAKCGGRRLIDAMGDHLLLAAYGGCRTEAEAEARRVDLLRKHETMRPAILILNAKLEGKDDSLLDFVRQCAAADSPERLADVNIISPELGTSMAAFDLTRTSADIGDSIKTSIEIIDGSGDNYWAGRATGWLTHLISVMRVLQPGRINWAEVLRLAGDREYYAGRLADAEKVAVREARLQGQVQTGGARMPHAALEALKRYLAYEEKDWDAITSRILDFGRHIMTEKLAQVMAPEVPTFGTYNDVVREGRIVCVDMPMARYQNVARAVSILQINAFVSAAQEYGAASVQGSRRPTFVFIDEVHAFLSDEFRRALAMTRAADFGAFLGLQTTAQLAEGGAEGVATYLTNCQNKIAYREPDGAGAERLSKSYGLRETFEADFGLSESLSGVKEQGPAGPQAKAMNQSASMRIVKRDVPRFKAEAIMALAMGRAICSLTDGKSSHPARLVSTPQVRDVPWLADVETIEVPPYIPPVPLCPITDDSPDTPASRDRATYLWDGSDPSREDALAALPLRRAGELWGFLLWNHRFGFVVQRTQLDGMLRDYLDRALTAPVRFGHPLPAPPVLLRSVLDGYALRVMFAEIPGSDIALPLPAVPFPRPFVIEKAVEPWAGVAQDDAQVIPRGRPRVTAPSVSEADVRALWAMLPEDPAAYCGMTSLEWHRVTHVMQRILTVYRDMRIALKPLDEAAAFSGTDAVLPWLTNLSERWRRRIEEMVANPDALIVESDADPVARPNQQVAIAGAGGQPMSVPLVVSREVRTSEFGQPTFEQVIDYKALLDRALAPEVTVVRPSTAPGSAAAPGAAEVVTPSPASPAAAPVPRAPVSIGPEPDLFSHAGLMAQPALETLAAPTLPATLPPARDSADVAPSASDATDAGPIGPGEPPVLAGVAADASRGGRDGVLDGDAAPDRAAVSRDPAPAAPATGIPLDGEFDL